MSDPELVDHLLRLEDQIASLNTQLTNLRGDLLTSQAQLIAVTALVIPLLAKDKKCSKEQISAQLSSLFDHYKENLILSIGDRFPGLAESFADDPPIGLGG